MPAPPPPPPRRHDGSNRASGASKEENTYIPSFISKRPFYAVDGDESTDYLDHQRMQKPKDDDKTKWYDRGKKLGPAATKFRKGACENCGAMTHKTKECLSRPRAKGARWTGKDIQADDLVQEVQLGWDAKRDRWNGYDPKEYSQTMENYKQMEDLRIQATGKNKAPGDEDEDEEADAGEKYAEEVDMGKHQSTATRQLRIREDTAKYLLNLDVESAKYDPKTRKIVDAGATHDKAAQLFAEEGFLRGSGEAEAFSQAQQYAWEKQEISGDTSQHMQANPTAGEFFRKKEKEEAEKKRAAQLKALEDKYGGGTHAMPAALRDVIVTESEQFVEYDEAGLIKGAPRAVAKSKYPEDVFPNNHTSIFGSWWSNFQWGYACCHSFVKNSYCVGDTGKQAWEESDRQRTGDGLGEETNGADDEEGVEAPAEETKVEMAKKRPAEEMTGGITEAEMDEYRRKKVAADDPMAKFLGQDRLV